MSAASSKRKGRASGRALAAQLAAALAAVLLGCAAPTVSLQQGPREYVSTDYDIVLKRWTRTENLILFSELENALTVSATFETWDFRWAYVIRYARDYRLTIPQRQRLLGKTLNETRRSHQFFVALFGGDHKYNDLTKDSSAWIVRLIDSTGNETAPEQVVRLRKPNALERRYYPYNSVWRMSFRIRFPTMSSGRPTISPAAEWLGLRFAGAMGNIDLLWQLEQSSSDEEAEDEDEPKTSAQI